MDSTEQPEIVYVGCDNCGQLSNSGLIATVSAPQSGTFRDNQSKCQHCGNVILWSKAELIPAGVVMSRNNPIKLISAFVLICEKLLTEQDRVFSAIRIAERYRFAIDEQMLPESRPPIVLSALAMLKGEMISETPETHALTYELIRPDGELQQIAEPYEVKITHDGESPHYSVIAPITLLVVPRQLGTHYIVWKADGREIARCLFILEATQSPNTPNPVR